MALYQDECLVYGLLYLWIRDGNLDLNAKTARYIEDHCRALFRCHIEFSDEGIVEFLDERSYLVQRVVRRLRRAWKARKSRARSRPHMSDVPLDSGG